MRWILNRPTSEHAEGSGVVLGTLELEGYHLGLLDLLSEDGLGLATENLLLHIVAALAWYNHWFFLFPDEETLERPFITGI